MKTQQISLDHLHEADWNANRVRSGLMAKLRRSLEQFGVVENLVARPHPTLPGCLEVLSGNHRLRLLRELGYEHAPVVVVELDDARARLLAQTLNRTRGTDDPAAYALLLEQVLAELDISEVTDLLPETEATIYGVLRELTPRRPLDSPAILAFSAVRFFFDRRSVCVVAGPPVTNCVRHSRGEVGVYAANARPRRPSPRSPRGALGRAA
jgi:ParB-like chromosome segregation protein Spo0J